MKKTVLIILSLALLCYYSFSIHAQNNQFSYEFYFNKCEIVVCGNINESEAYIIAYTIYCNENGISYPAICSPCDISGHYYKYSTVTSKTHRVYSSSPRCLLNTYNVTICTKCSSTLSKSLIESERIVCCS
ncbi:MAG: hypothetical protein IKU52_02205 [Clostridia bacterium]|nr:hypothetical protein [Clostridia bacterium]